jgi:transposase
MRVIYSEIYKQDRCFFTWRSISVMEGMLCLSLSANLWIDQVTPTDTALIVHVVSTQMASHCPLCGQASKQIHSRYRRVVADVPSGSKPVRLHLEVRKFFCGTSTCPRKIFTERLPDLVQPSARKTNRLQLALQALGLATGGEVGSQLAPKLGMQVTPTTLLRCLRAISSPTGKTVRVLGLDDGAYKRGQTYGTILVDLERHRVIDLLPDRRSETIKDWLQQHPEIDVISRDRASGYADAARQGAPQALQVADRFHLIKNVREKLKELLDRKRSCLPLVEKNRYLSAPGLLPLSPAVESVAESEVHKQEKDTLPVNCHILDHPNEDNSSCPLTAPERRRKLNRDKRYALYEEVKDLRKLGLSHYAIADALGISRPTVRRFLAAEQFPERVSGSKAQHKNIVVAPYLSFLRERWQAGCHNGRQLFREAKARGYSGSRAQLERVTTKWRKQLPPSASISKEQPRRAPASVPKRQRLSSQQASWLFVVSKEKLTAEQQRQLDQICQASEDLSLAYALSQTFIELLKEHKAQELKDWLRQARGSHLNELKSIAKSMQQDYDAIYAACAQPWSQGQVEGQINRLKCIKRQMYGRAKFDLLRLRVLQAA